MSVRRRQKSIVTPADKVNKDLYTAEQIAQLTGFSGRTIRRAFSSGAIRNVVKPGAGKRGMPARVASFTNVQGWCRRLGIEL